MTCGSGPPDRPDGSRTQYHTATLPPTAASLAAGGGGDYNPAISSPRPRRRPASAPPRPADGRHAHFHGPPPPTAGSATGAMVPWLRSASADIYDPADRHLPVPPAR
jgi:hypothetical protein